MQTKPRHTFEGHPCEGFALAWSPVVPYRLASGDCDKYIHVWDRHEGGSWVRRRPHPTAIFTRHPIRRGNSDGRLTTHLGPFWHHKLPSARRSTRTPQPYPPSTV